MKTLRCDRCNRRYRNQPDWNGIFRNGFMTGVVCGDCQTVDENTKAVVNEATTNYLGVDAFGRVIGGAK